MMTELNRLLTSAFEADSGGRFDDAERLYTEFLARDRHNRDVLLYYGLLAAKSGRAATAIERLQRLLNLDPNSTVALNWLSMLLREQGRISEAIGCSERAVKISPNDADAQYNLGLCYHVEGRHSPAIASFEKALTLCPNHPSYLFGLGLAFEAVGADWPALIAVRASVQTAPETSALLKRAKLALTVGRIDEAIASARQALAVDPNLADAHLLLAEAFLEENYPDIADNHIRLAMTLDPSSEQTFLPVRARRLRWLGRFDEAIPLYEQAIAAEPKQGAAYFEIVSSRKIGPEDRPLVDQMKSILANGGLAVKERIHLHYALGKAHDNLGEFSEAMAHYDEANRLTLKSRPGGLPPFDRAKFKAKIDASIELFSSKFIQDNQHLGSPSDEPIFVLGMMRSGTTLFEQILSNHPKVGAAGEQGFWTSREHQIVDYRTRSINRLGLRKATRAYLELLRTIDPISQFVTDKNPANCMVAGLIALAYPNARIIQMSRDSVDTCLSIYMTPVRIPPDFACDRGNIVFAYKQYLRLMKHWQAVLDPARFRVVQYEDLVADKDRVTREVLSFCGLEWDPACVHPEDNRGRVSTPSFWQVRQPINAGSIQRWKRYEPWLGEFRELLDV